MRFGTRRLAIMRPQDRRAKGSRLPLSGRFAALDLLRRLAEDPLNMAELRRLFAEQRGTAAISWQSNREVLEQLAARLDAGALSVMIFEAHPVEVVPLGKGAEATEAKKPPAPSPKKQLTWIEIKVVSIDTGKPVRDVDLTLKLPSGDEEDHTTNPDGIIRVDDLDPGTCEARSIVKGATRAEVLSVQGMGAPSESPEAAPAAEEEQAPSAAGRIELIPKASGKAKDKPKEAKPSGYKLGVVERHKVKTGETLDGLAKKVGLSWKELAKFNWGTDVPGEINQALRTEVGCTKKTKDGKNYVFDDEDDPGIVLLPSGWEASLGTTTKHTILVAKVEIGAGDKPAPPWIFSL